MIKISTAESDITFYILRFPSSISKPGAYITHNAT